MRQGKFSLTSGQWEFVERHGALGFRDRSALVRAALERFRVETERERMERSAQLYASLYAHDDDLQALTSSTMEDWPE